MNKQEYLEKLESCLRHRMSREEIDDIMRDYAEYFEEGRRQSKQDSEISAKLGDPELVAQQLIEENAEQQSEYHPNPKPKDKNKVFGWAQSRLKKARERFDEWNHGDGSYKQEQENPSEEEMLQVIEIEPQQPKDENKPKEKKEPRNLSFDSGVFVRGIKAFGRGLRWCVYAFMAFMLLCVAAVMTGGLLFAAAGVLGGLFAAEIMAVIGALMCVAGIVLSGFGFVLMGKWTGLAIVSSAVAGIGFFVIIALLLDNALRKFLRFCKGGFNRTVDVWKSLLLEIESWLIVDKQIPPAAHEDVEKPSAQQQDEQPQNEQPQNKRSYVMEAQVQEEENSLSEELALMEESISQMEKNMFTENQSKESSDESDGKEGL